jgi:hypothetical protein
MSSETSQAALHTPSCGHALVKSALRVWRGRRPSGNAGEFGRRAPRHIFEAPPQRLVMERARFGLAKIFAFGSARSAATYFFELLIVAAIYIGFGRRRHPQKAKGRSQACAVRNTSSINNASMPDLRNVTMASVGAQTIGSLSLKDVLTTSGTPVFAKKRDMRS